MIRHRLTMNPAALVKSSGNIPGESMLNHCTCLLSPDGLFTGALLDRCWRPRLPRHARAAAMKTPW
eukprot:scaffold76133_cov20-Prasinocladus_malaysianus.AAC.1